MQAPCVYKPTNFTLLENNIIFRRLSSDAFYKVEEEPFAGNVFEVQLVLGSS